jgi:hypothetical protein
VFTSLNRWLISLLIVCKSIAKVFVTGIPATNYHMYYHMHYHLIAGTIATNYNRQGTLYRITTEGSKIIHQARESFYDYSGFLGLSYTIRQ